MKDQTSSMSTTQGQERVWVKRYSSGSRRWRMHLLNWVVGWMQLPALRAPLGGGAEHSCAVELRRLSELAALGVRVPRVIASSKRELLLSDLGTTLALQLRQADQISAAHLYLSAIAAIARAHAAGTYLGQPQARNIVVDAQQRIGFIDFEEDPAEVMTLAEAQCRDWLLFASGTLRHLPFADERISDGLRSGLSQADPAVRAALAASLQRLQPVRQISARLGRRARGMAAAIDALRSALGSGASDPESDSAESELMKGPG